MWTVSGRICITEALVTGVQKKNNDLNSVWLSIKIYCRIIWLFFFLFDALIKLPKESEKKSLSVQNSATVLEGRDHDSAKLLIPGLVFLTVNRFSDKVLLQGGEGGGERSVGGNIGATFLFFSSFFPPPVQHKEKHTDIDDHSKKKTLVHTTSAHIESVFTALATHWK